MFSLTKGSLKSILDGQTAKDPIMHVLSIKNINSTDGTIRYKVTLYDGETQHTFGILATQKNSMVETEELKIGSVIKLHEFAANVLSKDPPKVVIILLNFDVIGFMDPKSSTATSSEAKSTAPVTATSVQNENIEPPAKKPLPSAEVKTAAPLQSKSFFNSTKETSAQHNATKLENSTASSTPGMFNGFKVFGISSLNPYQNKWSIKARVTNKSAIRTWANAKGEGKLFSVEFIDNTGEIRASAFNEQCDKFYDLLQIDHVYFISRATLKTANKQWSTLNNDYEMTFTNETQIEPCHEASDNLPHMNLNIIPLSELKNKNAGDLVDVIGIVKSASEVSTITAKQTQKELKKRDLHLVDNSNCAVNCTLWGKQAEEFDSGENPVILLKGVKVSDFGGRSLGVLGNTVMQVNPDIPEAHTMRGWFDQGGSEASMQDLSNQTGSQGTSGGTGGISLGGQSWKTLDMLKDEKLGMGDKADYFTTKATVIYAKKDNSMYMACPGENCNKKVIDQNDGTYRCEKCARNYNNFKWRMILSVNIADFVDSQWATCFQETAEAILGIKADELGNLKSSNNPNYDEAFSNCVFKEFNFRLRAKMETYNDERRVKVSVVSIEPIDYAANAKRLLHKLKSYQLNKI